VRTDPSELLEDAPWLNGLARRLARDGATAEDLLQELWLRAWKAGPADPRRRRPWLARVLANLARKERRGSLRRHARERCCAKSEATPTTHEVAERLEAQRMLLEELERLAEPFRSVLVLRFQDELTSAEIARRLALPAGTIRWRIHEGLARLRERLDERQGGERASGVLLLAPLLDTRSPWPLTVGIGMNAASKCGLATAALGLVALPVWLATRRAPERLLEGASRVEVAATALAAPPVEEPLRGVALEREAIPLAPESRSEPAPSVASAAPPAVARIEGRALDALRRPLASAWAEWSASSSRADCSGDGRFALALESAEIAGAELRVHAAGRASRVLVLHPRAGETLQVGDVVLGPGASVAGWVRTADGGPAADVRVVVARPRLDATSDDMQGPLLEPESAEARSARDGHFRIEDAPAGMIGVWALRPGAVTTDNDARSDWVRSSVFALAEQGTREDLVLVLTDLGELGATAITGVVLTPAREPLPHARVRVEARMAASSFQETIAADEHGRFVYDPRQPCVAKLEASDPEASWRGARRADVRGGARGVELVLAEPRWIELAVRQPDGAAPAEFRVRTIPLLASGARGYPLEAEGHEGHLRLAVPLDRFALEVDAAGFARALLGPFEPESAPAELTCALEGMPGLRGRVTFAGNPVAGARLELRAYAQEGSYVETQGFPTRLWVEAEETTHSGADGSFVLTGREAGTRTILCEAEGFALGELGPLDVSPETGSAGLELELTRGGSIEGQVRTAPGVAPAGIIVGANRFDTHPRTLRTDEQGRFRFDGLAPGDWRIERVREELDPKDLNFLVDPQRTSGTERLQPNCSVRAGAATPFTLDLTAARPAVLAARVLVDGEPAEGWSLVLWPSGVNSFHGDLPGGRLDPSGEVRVEVEPGRYEVRLREADDLDFEDVAELELELPPGETPLALAFATGAIEGRYAGAPAGALARWSVRREDGLTSRTLFKLDADGRFARSLLLCGSGVLEVLERNASGNHSALARRELVLEPGATARIELP
jgi:RNA polymerase sigma-70 factor (ECF subfamily)